MSAFELSGLTATQAARRHDRRRLARAAFLMAGFLSRFAGAKRGGLALYAALAIPVLLGVAGGALDIADAQSQRAHFLNIAQGAALNGAADLSLAANSTMATS